MALIRQNSFAHGIVGPAVYGRSDLDLYTSALREARNCIIRLEGGLSNRQGLMFTTPVKAHSYAPRLIDFTYKTGDSYSVEIGDGYVRFVRAEVDAALAEPAKAITAITKANPAVATVVAHGYANGDETEFDDVLGMTQVNGRRFIVAGATTDTFQLVDQLTGVAVDSTAYTTYVSGGTSSRIYTLAAPWAIEDVPDLNYEQDKDTVTFTHQKYPTYLLRRLGAVEFTLEPKEFTPQVDPPVNLAVTINTPGTVTAVYKVTAVAQDTAEESLPAVSGTAKTITNIVATNPVRVIATAHTFLTGDEVYLDGITAGYTDANQRRFTVTNVGTNQFDLLGEDGSTYTYQGAPTFAYVAPWDQASVKTGLLTLASFGVAFSAGSVVNLFDGSTGNVAFFSNPTTMPVNSSISWSVPAGQKFWPSEITIRCSGAPSYNTWVVEGSDDGLAWDSPYATFTWNTAVQVVALAGVPTGGKRFWRIRKSTSGVTSGNPFIEEFSFKTATTTGTASGTFVRITTSSATWQNTITVDAEAGAQAYNFYRLSGSIFGYLGQSPTPSFTDSNVTPSATITPPQANDPFKNSEYPGAFGFFSQRQVYGGSIENPGRSHYTQTGAQNFNTSIPLQDDDAITADLVARQVNEIRHYVAANDLIVFTNSAEWRVNSGPDSKFTYATIKQKPQTNWGSSRLKPWIVGNEVLFVEPSGCRVRNLAYNLEYDSYESDDLSLLASQLLIQNPLTAWCFAYTYEQRMHGVLMDGTMVAETYHAKQKVNGWTWWDTKGDFENCCALRTNEVGVGDSVYVVVKRKINGHTVRYIEKVVNRVFTDVRDAFYLDCGLSYDDPQEIEGVSVGATTTFTITAHGFSNGQQVDVSDLIWWPLIDDDGTPTQPDQFDGRFKVANVTADTFTLQTLAGVDIDTTNYQDWRKKGRVRIPANVVGGLWHLEGERVSALADGNVYENLLVTSGKVTLPGGVTASRIHVGIPYVSIAETLDLDSPQVILNGRLKSIHHLYVECYQSRGFFVGNVSEVPGKKVKFTKINWRTVEPMDKPTALYTGIKKIPLTWTNGRAGRIRLQQKYPLPMNINWVTPDALFDDAPAA